MVGRERVRLLVTVKAYPQISEKYHETVCVAGVRIPPDAPGFVRLYPIPYRYMDDEKQFRKYDLIELDVTRHPGDRRPESYRPDLTTLQVVGHVDSTDGWRRRLAYVDRLISPSMCAIRGRQERDGTSLGLFRPARIDRFRLEPAERRSAGKEALAAQIDLFDQDRKRLEQIPYQFFYEYHCADGACGGHRMKLLDWEAGASYLSWRTKYPSKSMLEEKLRLKWHLEMIAPERDLHFFVGNAHQHPNSFMLLGAFYPPRGRVATTALF